MPELQFDGDEVDVVMKLLDERNDDVNTSLKPLPKQQQQQATAAESY